MNSQIKERPADIADFGNVERSGKLQVVSTLIALGSSVSVLVSGSVPVPVPVSVLVSVSVPVPVRGCQSHTLLEHYV